MKNNFSFGRLVLLIKKHWSENKKIHLLSFLAITSIFIIAYLYNIFIGTDNVLSEDVQLTLFGLLLIGSSTLYALNYFTIFQKKASSSSYLLLPASTLEKLLCAVFYCTLLVGSICVGLFFLINPLMVKLLNNVAEHSPEKYYRMFDDGQFEARKIADLQKSEYFFMPLVRIYFALHALALLGSLYFKERSFIKTIASICLLIFLLLFLHNNLLHLVMPMPYSYHEFDNFRTPLYSINKQGDYIYETPKYIAVPQAIVSTTKILFTYCLYPVLIIATYFRLKEKQV